MFDFEEEKLDNLVEAFNRHSKRISRWFIAFATIYFLMMFAFGSYLPLQPFFLR